MQEFRRQTLGRHPVTPATPTGPCAVTAAVRRHRSRIVHHVAVGVMALVGTTMATVVGPAAVSAASGAGGPTLSIVAGTGRAGAPTPGPATASDLDVPNGIAFDSSGDVYLVDSGNNVVEKIAPTGTLSLFAGTGRSGAPTPGPATASDLNGPGAIVFDSSGTGYIADSGNNVIEKVTPSGTLSIFAGTGRAGAPTPGPATASDLDSVNQIALDDSGNLYITDSGNDVVEKVTPSGTLSILAGTGRAGAPTPGPADASDLNYPGGVAVDSSGDVYIGDFGNNVVERVTPSGTLSIVAGTGRVGTPTPGPATASPLGGPAFVAVDSSDDVYIADFGANVVERVTPSGTLSIVAGTGRAGAPTPGPATASPLDQPVGVAVDPSGDVYIGDSANNVVEKVTLATPSPPVISNLPSSGRVGGTFTPSVITTGDGLTSVTTDAPAVCSVHGATVTYVGVGTCTLTAHVGIGATFAAADGPPQAFTVAASCQGVVGGTGGYWLAGSDGQIYPFGSATNDGSPAGAGVTLAAPIVGITATPDCQGYWLVASDGGIFAFGDAHFFGSMGGRHLDAPVVGMATTPEGGYYEVASDGGIFAFGPGAGFHGSMGGRRLNQPVVGMATTPEGGYYEVASDGGIFAFSAPYHGSTGCLRLDQPIRAMVVSPDVTTVGRGGVCTGSGSPAPGGYQFVARDGGVFSFGNTTFAGSLGGTGIVDVVGMADA